MSQLTPSFLLSAGVAQAVESMPAAAFGNKLRWFDSQYQHISLRSPGSWRHARSSIKKLRWFNSQNRHIALGSPGSSRIPAAAFGNKLRWFESHHRHISLCRPGSWTGVAFGNKLRWFESHYRHTSLCSPGCWMRARSSIKKLTTLVRFPPSAYFFRWQRQLNAY